MELSNMTDEQLEAQRIAVLVEQERRNRIADMPDQLAQLAREYIAAGGDPEVARAAFEAGLSGEPDEEQE